MQLLAACPHARGRRWGRHGYCGRARGTEPGAPHNRRWASLLNGWRSCRRCVSLVVLHFTRASSRSWIVRLRLQHRCEEIFLWGFLRPIRRRFNICWYPTLESSQRKSMPLLLARPIRVMECHVAQPFVRQRHSAMHHCVDTVVADATSAGDTTEGQSCQVAPCLEPARDDDLFISRLFLHSLEYNAEPITSANGLRGHRCVLCCSSM